MTDDRVSKYARLLVERSVDVQPGWQVIVQSTTFESRPLIEEVIRLIAEKGAFALPRVALSSSMMTWLRVADDDIIDTLPSIAEFEGRAVDAYIIITDPDNTRDTADIAAAKISLYAKGRKPVNDRRLRLDVPWVGCQYPTAALAQDAGMPLAAFADFLYGACLLDWDEEARKMRHLADRFDKTSEVRIVGDKTDLTVVIEGREAMVDDGHLNMPGGEFFYSPVEDATSGIICYSEFPAVYGGHEVEGVRLRFKDGRIVDASAESDEEFLLSTLDADAGARVLGELGIGCNPGIQRHMKNVLFDEKIYGTVHLAVGAGFPFIGGKNVSVVHWDMVKDLRQGGQIFCDGDLVQENGAWLI